MRFVRTNPAPVAFTIDTFSDVPGTTIASHTGERGATWTPHPLGLGDSGRISDGYRARTYGGTDAFYYASGVPATAEYDVNADFYYASSQVCAPGIMGRAVVGANTAYVVFYNAGGWELYKVVAATYTLLGSYTQALTVGQTYAVRLQIRHATKKVFVDGVERISSADNAITGAGRSGFRVHNAGSDLVAIHVDNFIAADPVGAAVTPIGSVTIFYGGTGDITLPSDIPVGHGIVVVTWGSDSLTSITDDAGNTFHLADISGGSGANSGQISSAPVTTPATAGQKIHVTTPYGVVRAEAYDVSAFAGLDKTSEHFTSYASTKDTGATAALASAREVAFALFVQGTTGGTIPAPFTKLIEADQGFGIVGFVAEGETPSAAGIGTTLTLPGPDSGTGMIAVYKEVASSGDIVAAAPPAALTLSAPVPVLAEAAVSVPAALTVAAPVPVGALRAPTTAASVALAAPVPTLATTAVAAPAVLALAGLAPTLRTTASTDPATIALSAPAPTVSYGGAPLTVAPPAATLALAAPAPTAELRALAAPATQALAAPAPALPANAAAPAAVVALGALPPALAMASSVPVAVLALSAPAPVLRHAVPVGVASMTLAATPGQLAFTAATFAAAITLSAPAPATSIQRLLADPAVTIVGRTYTAAVTAGGYTVDITDRSPLVE